MVTEMMNHLEVAVDGIQILLCLLIIVFLARNHRYPTKPGQTDFSAQTGRDFSRQVISQSIQQQVELAFSNILNVAASEHRNLGKLLQFHASHPIEPRLAEDPPGQPRVRRDDSVAPAPTTQRLDERQGRIAKLAARGMNAKQISEELKIATGEVELILSLQANR